MGVKRFQTVAEITNKDKRDFKSGQELQMQNNSTTFKIKSHFTIL